MARRALETVRWSENGNNPRSNHNNDRRTVNPPSNVPILSSGLEYCELVIPACTYVSFAPTSLVVLRYYTQSTYTVHTLAESPDPAGATDSAPAAPPSAWPPNSVSTAVSARSPGARDDVSSAHPPSK